MELVCFSEPRHSISRSYPVVFCEGLASVFAVGFVSLSLGHIDHAAAAGRTLQHIFRYELRAQQTLCVHNLIPF